MTWQSVQFLPIGAHLSYSTSSFAANTAWDTSASRTLLDFYRNNQNIHDSFTVLIPTWKSEEILTPF